LTQAAMSTAGWLARSALVVAGVVLGMAIVAGHGFWHGRPHADVPASPPPASVPAGSFVAPGSQG
jgi:hypothetical protein